jgi:hypothetical protein
MTEEEVQLCEDCGRGGEENLYCPECETWLPTGCPQCGYCSVCQKSYTSLDFHDYRGR